MKKILFGILAVILSAGGVRADSIKELTLDTPVNWPMPAFYHAVVSLCPGSLQSSVEETAKMNSHTYNCYAFVAKYREEYKKNPEINLRKILEMCLDSQMGNDSVSDIDIVQKCVNITKSMVAYSKIEYPLTVQEQIEENYAGDYDRYYYGDLFYVKNKMFYIENRTYLSTPRIFHARTGRGIGKCEGEAKNGKIDCEISDLLFNSWNCYVDIVEQKLVCEQKS